MKHGFKAGTSVRMVALMTGACLTLVSCARKPPEAGTKADAQPVEKVSTLGPVTATVRLERSNLSLEDLIPLTVVAEAGQGIDVQMPDLVKNPGRFVVTEHNEGAPVSVGDGRRRWTDRYKLDVYVSGQYTVPALEVRFRDRRRGKATAKPVTTRPADDWRVLRTQELTLEVAGLKIDQKDLTRIRDIAGPVELPEPPRTWAWLYALGGGAVVAVLLVWAWRRRRRGGQAPVPTEPAHVRAYRRLHQIASVGLVEQGRIDEFYFLVSGVMRTYIEDRFGLRAPERTTTEFLAELAGSEALPDKHKHLLRDFLQHCDLVKFAHLAPTPTEVQAMFDAVRTFIEWTREDTVRVPVEAAA